MVNQRYSSTKTPVKEAEESEEEDREESIKAYNSRQVGKNVLQTVPEQMNEGRMDSERVDKSGKKSTKLFNRDLQISSMTKKSVVSSSFHNEPNKTENSTLYQ